MTSTDTPLAPRLPSPLLEVRDDRFERRGLRLLLKRDDLIHPELGGNKPTGVSGSDQDFIRWTARSTLTQGGSHGHDNRSRQAV